MYDLECIIAGYDFVWGQKWLRTFTKNLRSSSEDCARYQRQVRPEYLNKFKSAFQNLKQRQKLQHMKYSQLFSLAVFLKQTIRSAIKRKRRQFLRS